VIERVIHDTRGRDSHNRDKYRFFVAKNIQNERNELLGSLAYRIRGDYSSVTATNVVPREGVIK